MVDQHLRVMQSFGVPRATTNPYITMLDEELADTAGVTHLRFSWVGALFGDYDAFHWHWPEGKLHGSTWWKAAGKYVLTTLISLRHRISRRIAVVRTVHNLQLPDDNAVRLWLLRRIDAQTDHRIMLNTTTPVAPDQASTLILHGHYGDWYSCETFSGWSGTGWQDGDWLFHPAGVTLGTTDFNVFSVDLSVCGGGVADTRPAHTVT